MPGQFDAADPAALSENGTDAAAEQQRQFFHLAQHRLHDGRRLFVEVARQQDRAAFDNRNFAAAFEQALRKLKPEQPAADHDDPPDARVETGAGGVRDPHIPAAT